MATKKKKAAPEETSPADLISISLKDNATGERVVNLPPMTPKEAILLYLWGYSGQAKDESIKAQIIESHNFIKESLVAIKLLDLDRKKGTYKLRTSRKKKFSEEHINNHLDKPWTRLAIADVWGFKKEFLESQGKDPLRSEYIKVGRHGIKNLQGNSAPRTVLNFAESVEEIAGQTGLQLNALDPIWKGWGVNLKPTQHSVLLGVLSSFSDTEYKGDKQADRKEILSLAGHQQPGELLREAIRNIRKFPVVRLQLHEVVTLAGLDREADKGDVKQALEYLGSARYAFYWEKLEHTERNGKRFPVIKEDGKYLKKEVRTVGSILYVKEIVDPETGNLDYYEISPSEVFIDQVTEGYGSKSGYFLMVPRDLPEQVRRAVGNSRRSTAQHYTFIYFLLDEHERLRMHAKGKELPKIRKDWTEIAQRIRMPETVWKRNKGKAVLRLDKLYRAAKDLGYLKSYSMGPDGVVTLELNPEGPYYYPKEKLLKEAEAPGG